MLLVRLGKEPREELMLQRTDPTDSALHDTESTGIDFLLRTDLDEDPTGSERSSIQDQVPRLDSSSKNTAVMSELANSRFSASISTILG